ncbi:LOW QUALITY PROTEIN: beta-enolase [Poecile atricapillus]|uniref:LOW QUALITY PROTEIN: beta-enolase n=1 Tax=Poecile atricapillus TaxID=48891 RepID=UPI00273A03D9|nr:LOW QUALITY PROTEIN: beta-enolase [Poecile atricapillus]
MEGHRATSEHLELGGVCLWRLGSGWDPHDFGLVFWVPYPTAMFIHKIAALELLKAAIGKAGYLDKVVIGMDVAAAKFCCDGKYNLDFKSPPHPKHLITRGQLYETFIKDYPMVSTENPFDLNNWGGWKWFLTQADIQVVGSDLTATS